MKNKMLWMLAGVAMLGWARTLAAAPSVPVALNYQGRLHGDQGAALAAGSYGLEFRLWSAPTAGTLLWARGFSSVYVASNGVFNVILSDAGTELLPAPGTSDLLAAFTNGTVCLGITVRQMPSGAVSFPQQIAPARQFLSMPYSVTAHWADDTHQLINATNLLSRSGNWPADPVYAIGLNPGAPPTAVALTGLLESQPSGLRFGVPVNFSNVLEVPELTASSLSPSSDTLKFAGPVRFMQSAGTVTYANQGPCQLRLNPEQDGLYLVTFPRSGSTYSIECGGSGYFLNVYMSTLFGYQRFRFIPVKAGWSATITIFQPIMPNEMVTVQFLPFGVP